MSDRQQDIPAIEFVPNGSGMLVVEPQPQPLPAAERARAITAARVVLHQLDTDADGRLSGEEAGRLSHGAVALIVAEARQSLRAYNAQVYPWMARQSSVIDDVPLFNRDMLITALRGNDTLGRLTREDLDRTITEALPGGVGNVTLAQECREHPELPCLPVGRRVSIHLDGPTI